MTTSDLAARVEQLMYEGAVRHITIEHDGHTPAAFPMATGVAGAQEHVDLARRYEMERRLRVRLEALHQASLAIASAHTPAQILQRLVGLARELIAARYAALSVLSPQGAIDEFYMAGISPEERARLSPLPQGHGLLGVTLTAGATLRLPDVTQNPRSVGFPLGHP